MPRYRIYAIRLNKLGPDAKETDKILITGSASFKEAKRDFMRLVKNANFSEAEINITKRMLNKYKASSFKDFGSFTENLHGYLREGGYLLVKEEDES